MNYSFPVQIVDDSDKPVSGARVCLVRNSALGTEQHPYPSLTATHKDIGKGKYDDGKSIAMATGDWVLVVTLKGKAPVVQPLKVTTARDGTFVVLPRSQTVATVKFITPVIRTVSSAKLKEISFRVTFYPANELVFIGGADYNRRDISGGWKFYLYGFKRAEVLRREKKIHPGTIVTVFSTGESTRTTRVWGKKGWVDVDVSHLGDISLRTLPSPGETYQPVKGIDIHINDFYDYLAGLGKSQPNSVQEIGIFSHSWPGGPILYDTGEGAFNRRPERNDAIDFDARPKDFNDTNFPKHKGMLAAFGPNCTFRIWGCSATTHFKVRSQEALKAIKKKMAEDDFFKVRSDVYDHHPHMLISTKEELTSELRHRYEMDVLFRSRTYPAEAAKRLGIEVRAGCPGTESAPKTIEGIEMMMVPMAEYQRVFDYYRAKFSPEFNETEAKWDKGYVDYQALQQRPPVPKPPFSMRYYNLDILYRDDPWTGKKAGAYLTFGRPTHPIINPDVHVTIEALVVPDLVTHGVKGQLLMLKTKDPRQSQAVYVQEDQRIFELSRKDGKWTKPLREL